MHKAKAEFDKHKFSYQNTKHKISYQKATLIYRITKHSNNKSTDRYLDIYKTEYRHEKIQITIQPPYMAHIKLISDGQTIIDHYI